MSGLNGVELADVPRKLKAVDIDLDQDVPKTFEKAVRNLQAMVHGAAIKHKCLAWLIGKYARIMMDNEQKYGAAVAVKLAARLGMSKSYLYSFIKLYEAYPREDFDPAAGDPQISLAHLVLLARLPADADRRMFEHMIRKEGIGQLELARHISKALGQTVSRKPNMLSTLREKSAWFEISCVNGMWYWVLCASNGVAIAKSARGYKNKNDTLRSLQVVKETTDITETMEREGLSI